MRRIRLARLLTWLSDRLPRQHTLRGNLDHQPFFVFGSGRNGSTLLNRMLNQHDAIFLPPEQDFLGPSIIKYKLYNFLNWRDLTKIIVGELLPDSGTHAWSDYRPDFVLSKILALESQSLQNLIDLVYRDYGGGHFKIWGDSTPQNTGYIREIIDLFPDARILFLVRDPKDVVASYKVGGSQFLGKYEEPALATDLWMSSILAYRWIKRRTDVLLVKYEDLVSDPERELRLILDFLDVPFQKEVLRDDRVRSDVKLYEEPQHNNIRSPINTKSIGKHRDYLTEEEIAAIEQNTRKVRSFLGY